MTESKNGKPEAAHTPPVVPVTAPTGLALGQKIADLRTLRRLSRAELAQRAGVHYSTIYKLEHGHVKPTMATLRALDTVFGGRVEGLEA
jgi:DNA-binding XRE family transcriptional regulator